MTSRKFRNDSRGAASRAVEQAVLMRERWSPVVERAALAARKQAILAAGQAREWTAPRARTAPWARTAARARIAAWARIAALAAAGVVAAAAAAAAAAAWRHARAEKSWRNALDDVPLTATPLGDGSAVTTTFGADPTGIDLPTEDAARIAPTASQDVTAGTDADAGTDTGTSTDTGNDEGVADRHPD